MKKFSNISEGKYNDYIVNEVKSLINDNIKVKINGNLDDYLSENIEIVGKDKLEEKIDQYIDNKILESNKILLETVRYKGLDITEKILENKNDDK